MKKYTGITWFGMVLTALIGIMFALLVLALSGCGTVAARAEAAPSPTVRGMYSMESTGVRLSEAPMSMTIIDIATVDIDACELAAAGKIIAKIGFPALPDDGIECVILFDGWHIAQGHWIRTEDKSLIVTFYAEDLTLFDGTVGLFLVLVGHAG